MSCVDWLHFSRDVHQVMADYWKDVDTILMGRKTWAFAAAHNRATAKNAKKAKRRTLSDHGMHTYVFWRTLKAIDEPVSNWSRATQLCLCET